MPGPNLTGTGLFGGFLDPAMRKYMQQRRTFMGTPVGEALTPQRAGNTSARGLMDGIGPRASAQSGMGSLFARFQSGL
jgi:hypothetical protein